MHCYEDTESKLIMELSHFEYRRKIGAFRPKFQGLPENYYPLSNGEATLYAALVIAVIGGSLGIMIGMLAWITRESLEQFTIVWSVIMLCFWAGLIIIFYVGGRGRIREEKRMIVQAQKQQEQMKNKSSLQ